MIRIKNLTVKNFMSVGNVTQAIDFDRRDLTLVLGENLDLGGDGSRNGTGKTTTLHLAELVHQHIPNRTNVACKATAAAQHQGLAEGTAIGERGEIQFNGLHAFQGRGHGVRIIRQL